MDSKLAEWREQKRLLRSSSSRVEANYETKTLTLVTQEQKSGKRAAGGGGARRRALRSVNPNNANNNKRGEKVRTKKRAAAAVGGSSSSSLSSSLSTSSKRMKRKNEQHPRALVAGWAPLTLPPPPSPPVMPSTSTALSQALNVAGDVEDDRLHEANLRKRVRGARFDVALKADQQKSIITGLRASLKTVLAQRQRMREMIERASAEVAREAKEIENDDTATAAAGTIDAGNNNNGAQALSSSSSSSTTTSAAATAATDELTRRITALEEEKLTLSLALAPLESRLEDQAQNFQQERSDLEKAIAALEGEAAARRESLAACERSRDEFRAKAAQAEGDVRRLTRDVEERETKTAQSFWQRTMAASREQERLESEVTALQERLVTAGMERDSLNESVAQLRAVSAAADERYAAAKNALDRLSEAERVAVEAGAQLEMLKAEHMAVCAQLSAMQTELAVARSDLAEQQANALPSAELQTRVGELESANARLKSEIELMAAVDATDGANADEDLEEILDSAGGGNLGSTGALSALKQAFAAARRAADAEIEAGRARERELERSLAASERTQRSMHNRIQELRGNIRVFVRTRPFLPGDECDASERPVIRCVGDGGSVVLAKEGGGGGAAPPSRSFTFDRAFPPSAGQGDVFEEVQEFVQSAMDGYRVCLFSYGQTGSGKTHTMQGTGDGQMRGIIPRSLEKVLAAARRQSAHGWSYDLRISFLEIYNEQMRDLLGSGEEKIAVRQRSDNKKEGHYVSGLTLERICTETDDEAAISAQLTRIMATAAAARSVGRTAMNSQSSRSHSVFTLHIAGRHAENGAELQGSLNLVDLAGSERLDRSGAEGARLREAQHINKSLSCLADVFVALGNGASHVPFRNSKLTYLLQDCFSGDGKALMFVNLSPTEASLQESMCSLRFAKTVNQVDLGRATKHVRLTATAAAASSSGLTGGGSGSGARASKRQRL